MSKDAYYFSHDTNAFFDPKIRLIVSEFGVFAYGVFWIILEMLAAQKEYKILRKDFEKALCPLLQGKKIIYSGVGGVTGFIDEEDNQITEQLVGCHCISLAYATELFCMMLNIGLFKTDDIFFYSESLLERMKKKEELSEKYRNNALKRWEKHNNAMALQSVKPSTARKERKGKESIYIEPPSLEEVSKYCLERNNGVNPDQWYNHYTAKGWFIGKNKMKDWRAAVRTWEKPKEDEHAGKNFIN